MAKGNIFLGYGRGKIGDITLARVNGQQVTKPCNHNPNNPRSAKQCLQRSIFAAAVKFFTRGNQSFYKFAFENKRMVESDYNAFMRENVKRAPAISKEAFDNYDYPVIAPFIMAKGSLAPIDNAITGGAPVITLGATTETTAPTTIGTLSSILVAGGQYEVGDIVTIVLMSSEYNGSVPSAEANGKGKTKWTILQFIVDTTSTATLASTIGFTAAIADGVLTLTGDAFTAAFNGFTAVHTRETSGGLKSSTQELVLDTASETAYESAQADAYKDAVIASWKKVGSVDAQPEAILQGSIAYGNQ